MREIPVEARELLTGLAERMIQRYARGLLTVEWLVAQLSRTGACDTSWQGEQNWCALETQALSLCCQALYEGCFKRETSVRELAFENLGCYLAQKLAHSSAGANLQASGLDAEVVQQTLVEIWNISRRPGAGPEQPTAFLKWASVILFRQLSRHLSQSRRTVWVSLETQPEPVLEELVDGNDVDPLATVLRAEAREELKAAILTLKNPQYQQVLLSTFFAGLEERELAARWQVRVQDIYLWRCRALKALRKHAILAQDLKLYDV